MEEALEWIEILTGYRPLELLFATVDHYRDSEPRMAHKAHVVHHSPGRVRLRMQHKRHDAEFFRAVQARLSEIDSVHSVEVNPATGSILVRYSGEISHLIGQAMAYGLQEFAEVEFGLPPLEPISGRLKGRLGGVSTLITRATGGTVDGGSAVVIALLLAGTFQVVRGQVLGPAVPLLWYAAQAVSGMLPESRKN